MFAQHRARVWVRGCLLFSPSRNAGMPELASTGYICDMGVNTNINDEKAATAAAAAAATATATKTKRSTQRQITAKPKIQK